jgi:hypothetical protein
MCITEGLSTVTNRLQSLLQILYMVGQITPTIFPDQCSTWKIAENQNYVKKNAVKLII